MSKNLFFSTGKPFPESRNLELTIDNDNWCGTKEIHPKPNPDEAIILNPPVDQNSPFKPAAPESTDLKSFESEITSDRKEFEFSAEKRVPKIGNSECQPVVSAGDHQPIQDYESNKGYVPTGPKSSSSSSKGRGQTPPVLSLDPSMSIPDERVGKQLLWKLRAPLVETI